MITARENILKAYKHEKPYWVPAQVTDQDTCIPSCLEEGPTGLGVTEDGWGVHWRLEPSQPGPFPDESFQRLSLDDLENWKELLVFPDYEKYDWEAAAARDTAKWDRENKISSVIIVNGMFERMHALMGMEDAMCALIEDPEDAFDLLSAIADHKCGYIRKIAQYYKPDKIQFHDDYGAIDRMLMSVDVWREMIRPNLKKVIDCAHECGIIYEHHSCGYIKPIVGDIVELGADAWNPVQLTNGPEELLQKYGGKFTFVGGFDNIHVLDRSGVTQQERYDSIKATIQTLAPYGSWVAQPAMIDRSIIDPLVNALFEYNKPLMEAAGVEAKMPAGFSRASAYETAETIEDMKKDK